MNILYLHGLNSKLSDKKRSILEGYGNVIAPDIDYDLKHIQPDIILNQFPDTEFNVVIGSSMGALNGYMISDSVGRPALLFNPPLSKYDGNLSFKTNYLKINFYKQIVLGGIDDIVNPKETLKFLGNNMNRDEIDLHIDPRLGHRIPLDIFETQTKIFFSKLCY